MPDDFQSALAALDRHAYDPSARHGILLASPLRLGTCDDTWQSTKLAVILVAQERSEIFELERWFRERFEN